MRDGFFIALYSGAIPVLSFDNKVVKVQLQKFICSVLCIRMIHYFRISQKFSEISSRIFQNLSPKLPTPSLVKRKKSARKSRKHKPTGVNNNRVLRAETTEKLVIKTGNFHIHTIKKFSLNPRISSLLSAIFLSSNSHLRVTLTTISPSPPFFAFSKRRHFELKCLN